MVTCSICLEEAVELGRIDSCSHSYCFSCIHEWSKRENRCPQCKQRFDTIQRCKLPSRKRAADGEEPPDSPTLKKRARVLATVQVATKDQRYQPDPVHLQFLQGLECQLCGGGDQEDQLLICDGCDRAWHTYCCGLQGVPLTDEWLCPECQPGTSSQRRRPARAAAGSSGRDSQRRRTQQAEAAAIAAAAAAVAAVAAAAPSPVRPAGGGRRRRGGRRHRRAPGRVQGAARRQQPTASDEEWIESDEDAPGDTDDEWADPSRQRRRRQPGSAAARRATRPAPQQPRAARGRAGSSAAGAAAGGGGLDSEEGEEGEWIDLVSDSDSGSELAESGSSGGDSSEWETDWVSDGEQPPHQQRPPSRRLGSGSRTRPARGAAAGAARQGQAGQRRAVIVVSDSDPEPAPARLQGVSSSARRRGGREGADASQGSGEGGVSGQWRSAHAQMLLDGLNHSISPPGETSARRRSARDLLEDLPLSVRLAALGRSGGGGGRGRQAAGAGAAGARRASAQQPAPAGRAAAAAAAAGGAGAGEGGSPGQLLERGGSEGAGTAAAASRGLREGGIGSRSSLQRGANAPAPARTASEYRDQLRAALAAARDRGADLRAFSQQQQLQRRQQPPQALGRQASRPGGGDRLRPAPPRAASGAAALQQLFADLDAEGRRSQGRTLRSEDNGSSKRSPSPGSRRAAAPVHSTQPSALPGAAAASAPPLRLAQQVWQADSGASSGEPMGRAELPLQRQHHSHPHLQQSHALAAAAGLQHPAQAQHAQRLMPGLPQPQPQQPPAALPAHPQQYQQLPPVQQPAQGEAGAPAGGLAGVAGRRPPLPDDLFPQQPKLPADPLPSLPAPSAGDPWSPPALAPAHAYQPPLPAISAGDPWLPPAAAASHQPLPPLPGPSAAHLPPPPAAVAPHEQLRSYKEAAAAAVKEALRSQLAAGSISREQYKALAQAAARQLYEQLRSGALALQQLTHGHATAAVEAALQHAQLSG